MLYIDLNPPKENNISLLNSSNQIQLAFTIYIFYIIKYKMKHLHSYYVGNLYSLQKVFYLLWGRHNTQCLVLSHNINIATTPPNPIPNPIPNVNNDIFSSTRLGHSTLKLLLLPILPSLVFSFHYMGLRDTPISTYFFEKMLY